MADRPKQLLYTWESDDRTSWRAIADREERERLSAESKRLSRARAQQALSVSRAQYRNNRDLPGVSNLFNRQGIDLTISHVPTGFQVAFPAFLDLISDAYTCDWDEESVFGRMDSIPTFRSTRRALSLAWHVPAESFDQAASNVEKVNQLINFLYPLYDHQNKASGATSINQSPLVRVSFGNLIQNAVDGRGLLGYLSGITFDPALEFGMFTRKGNPTPKRSGGRTLYDWEEETEDEIIGRLSSTQQSTPSAQGVNQEYYPKTFRLNFELTVLHEHELGFKLFPGSHDIYTHLDRDVSFRNFPYGAAGAGGIRSEDQNPDAIRVISRKPPMPGSVEAVTASDMGDVLGAQHETAVQDEEVKTTQSDPWQQRPMLPGERSERHGGMR